MNYETKQLALELKFSGDGSSGEFEGIAAGYGNVDNGGDVFAPRVFATSLAEHKAGGTNPALLWQHDPSQPIGVPDELRETEDGLFIKGRLADTARGNEARVLAKMGAIKGLSVGYRVKSATRDAKGVRKITAAYLGEVSFVTVPMNQKARVTSIKSKGKTMESENIEVGEEIAELKAKIEELEGKSGKIDELEKKLSDALKRADAIELKMSRPGAPATKDELKDVQKKSLNLFLRGGLPSLGDTERKALGLESKSMTVGDPNASVLAPPEFAAEIIRNLVLFSPIRSVARVMQIGAGEVKIPRRTGNLTASWVGETSSRSESDPAYDNTTITPYELACYVDVSNALLEDSSYDVASEVAYDLGEEFGRAEGAAFVGGSGSGQPSGILTASLTQVHTGASGVISADNLLALFYALPSPYAARASWMMNRTTIGVVRSLKTTIGSYVWQDGLAAGDPPTLLGRPVVETPDMPNPGAGTVPIVFGDVFSGYRIADRVSLALLRDPYSQATSGLTRFHARRRVGGQVVKAEAFRALLAAA